MIRYWRFSSIIQPSNQSGNTLKALGRFLCNQARHTEHTQNFNTRITPFYYVISHNTKFTQESCCYIYVCFQASNYTSLKKQPLPLPFSLQKRKKMGSTNQFLDFPDQICYVQCGFCTTILLVINFIINYLLIW